MGGASAAACSSARQRNSQSKEAARRNNSRKPNISQSAGHGAGTDIDSSVLSDTQLAASMPSLNEKIDEIDSSFRSWTDRLSSSRRDSKHSPKRDDRDFNSSLDSRGGIELHCPVENNNTQAKGHDGFNENGNDDVASQCSSKLSTRVPSWFHTLNNGRKYIGERINDFRVQNFILLLIVINSIMMGVATFPFVKESPDLSYKFDLADQIFLIIFTVESGLQLLYYGWFLFKDGFLVFDLLIVIMSWALEGTQVIRAFRIFRALRLITRIEVMRNLVMALFSVVPKMTAIALLLMLIFFIFGVMMTTLFKGMYPEELTQPYFESLFYSLFTLFQMMTLVSI